MLLHLWFTAIQSLLLLLNATRLAESQQIPNVQSLVRPDRDSNPRSTKIKNVYGVFIFLWNHVIKNVWLKSSVFMDQTVNTT